MRFQKSAFLAEFKATWGEISPMQLVRKCVATELRLSLGDVLDIKAWIFLIARKLRFLRAERAAFRACDALTALLADAQILSKIKELSIIPNDDIPQVLAACCLKISAEYESQSNKSDFNDYLKLMNIEDPQVSAILPRLEVAVFAHLCCSATFAFSQATAVDLLEHLKFAADNFLPKCTSASFALQKRCLVRLLAFLHCTSFIDCRLLVVAVFMLPFRRAPNGVRSMLKGMLQEMVGTDVLMLSEPIIEALRPRLCTVEYEPRLALKAYFVGLQPTLMEYIMKSYLQAEPG